MRELVIFLEKKYTVCDAILWVWMHVTKSKGLIF
jgi:hypothetical protein